MPRPSLRRPRFADVTSMLALMVALGGTSYAVAKLPENSVGEAQIKHNAVRSDEIKDRSILVRDIGDGTVVNSKIANGSVSLNKLDGATYNTLTKPRAYGVFTSNGTLVAQRSKGASVSRLNEGDYCVNPLGAEPTLTTIIAAADWSDGTGVAHLVEVVQGTSTGVPSECPNGFHLKTLFETGGTFAEQDVAVHFVIP